jgi:hypothetical protein
MRLFIRVLNGSPVDHPMLEDNVRLAFPHIDLNNLPDDFAYFIRVQRPHPDIMPVGENQESVCTYVLASDGKSYQDEWSVRDLPNTSE